MEDAETVDMFESCLSYPRSDTKYIQIPQNKSNMDNPKAKKKKKKIPEVLNGYPKMFYT